MPQLIEFGSVRLPSLNVTAADPNVGKQLGVKSQGVLVQAVPSGGEAAKAGLLATRRGLGGIVAGDVIVEADGRRVVTEGDLVAAVEAHQVGESVVLKVRRGRGRRRTGRRGGDPHDQARSSRGAEVTTGRLERLHADALIKLSKDGGLSGTDKAGEDS